MASLGAGSDPQASKQNEEQMRKMKEQLEANERLLQEQSVSVDAATCTRSGSLTLL